MSLPVCYAPPIIRIVDRSRVFRERLAQHNLEQMLLANKKKPFDVESPRFNTFPWPWRRAGRSY